MSEVIVRLTSDHIKVKGGEYVQDLVRCGECKHKYEWDSGCGAELVCKVRRCDPGDWGRSTEFYVKPYDFCSHGEPNCSEKPNNCEDEQTDCQWK